MNMGKSKRKLKKDMKLWRKLIDLSMNYRNLVGVKNNYIKYGYHGFLIINCQIPEIEGIHEMDDKFVMIHYDKIISNIKKVLDYGL
jgi:hypothetical protein